MDWNDIIEVRCGWAEPLLEIDQNHVDDHQNNILRFNFHLNMENKLHWRVVLSYRDCVELRDNIRSYTEEIVIEAPFPSINSFALHPMLVQSDFLVDNVKALEKVVRLLETWMSAVLLSLPYLDKESQSMCKQFFFRDISRIPLFEKLHRKLQNLDVHQDTTASRPSVASLKVNREKTNPALLSSMTKLFTRKKGDGEERTVRAASGRYSLNADNLALINEKSPSKPEKSKKRFNFSFGFRSTSRSVVSFRSSSSQDEDTTSNNVKTALEVAQRSVLLRIEVQRGHEIKQGVLVYQINLIATGKMVKAPIVYIAYQRYNNFKKLFVKLNEINDQVTVAAGSPYANYMHLLKAAFPVAPLKSMFGLSLNDSDLSVRTRMLDDWFRDVCANYRNMPSQARQEVRTFLNLDMEKKKDQFFQDQLVWGTLETNGGGTVSLAYLNRQDDQPQLYSNSSPSYSYGGRPSSASFSSSSAPQLIALKSAIESSESRPLDVQSERNGLPGIAPSGKNQPLDGLIWETASQGGLSRVPKKFANKAARVRTFRHDQPILEEKEEDEQDG
eukprot:gene1124-1228_t